VLEGLVDGGNGRRMVLTAAAVAMVGRRRCVRTREEKGVVFIGAGEAVGARELASKEGRRSEEGEQARKACTGRRRRAARRGSGHGASGRERVEERVPKLARAAGAK
jgi:hypothetical protein